MPLHINLTYHAPLGHWAVESTGLSGPPLPSHPKPTLSEASPTLDGWQMIRFESAHVRLRRHGLAVYIQSDIIDTCGRCASLAIRSKCLRDFPESARHDAGYQLDKVQRGDQPYDFKPLPSIGKGVEEIRASQSSGACRVIYFQTR